MGQVQKQDLTNIPIESSKQYNYYCCTRVNLTKSIKMTNASQRKTDTAWSHSYVKLRKEKNPRKYLGSTENKMQVSMTG